MSEAVHPGLEALRACFRARMAGRHRLSFPERRASFAALMTGLNPVAEGATARETLAGLTVERAGKAGGPAILYLHGGAYVSGSPATHRHFIVTLARLTGQTVWLPDYRLAPEHPFPAAVDDAVAAYRALAGSGPVAIAGDSAGGGLAMAATLRLRAAGDPLPRRLLLLSPFVDLTLEAPSYAECAAVDPFLTREGLAADVECYVPDAARRRDPLASPLFADLAGLPPTLIQSGSDEVLRDDSRRLAASLRRAGVATLFEEWPGMVHTWHLFPNWLPEADWATAGAAIFLTTGQLEGTQGHA